MSEKKGLFQRLKDGLSKTRNAFSEGVENEQQLTLLRENNCDCVQGFVWGRPMEYESAVRLVEQS